MPEGHTLKRMNGKKSEMRWFTQCVSDHEGDKENNLDREARSNRWVGNGYLFITSIFSDYKNNSLLFKNFQILLKYNIGEQRLQKCHLSPNLHVIFHLLANNLDTIIYIREMPV